MLYSVRHQGVPVGVVELPPKELAVGFLIPTPAYLAVRPTVRAGSEALLAFGFFGAAAAERAGRETGRGELVPTTFVNLIEPPDDTVPVVVARLRDAHARVPAVVPTPPAAAPEAAGPPDA